MPSPFSVILSLYCSLISIRMPSPSSVILPSHSAVFSLIELCALDSSISLFNIPQNSSLVMQMPCSATQPTPVARTTKLRINKDIVQRTFGLRVRFISDGNKSHKTINRCFMFSITCISSYIWTIFHAVTLVCFELLASFLSLSFSPFSFPFVSSFFLLVFSSSVSTPLCFFLRSSKAGGTPAWYSEDAPFVSQSRGRLPPLSFVVGCFTSSG